MTSEHLLPANATPLEQALSLATDAFPGWHCRRTRSGSSRPIRLNCCLADLERPGWCCPTSLNPAAPSPRASSGSDRGTPAALATALSWIGMSATVEQKTSGVHFAEFQLDPGHVLDSDSAIAHLIAIAQLSRPRHVVGCRAFITAMTCAAWCWTRAAWVATLLSDHSGVFWRDGRTKLSFGRVSQLANPPADITLTPARPLLRFAVARLVTPLLDFSALGDPGHTLNEEILHSHLFTLANALGCQMRPRYARARRLHGRWWCLSKQHAQQAIYQRQLPAALCLARAGEAISLGGAIPLSAHVTPADSRWRGAGAICSRPSGRPGRAERACWPTATISLSTGSRPVPIGALGMWAFGESVPSLDRGFVRRDHTEAIRLTRCRWLAGTPSATNGRRWCSVRSFWARSIPTRPGVRCCAPDHAHPGDLTLGGGAIEWRTLTEMQFASG